jgi:flagellar basal-body rod protein FlgF
MFSVWGGFCGVGAVWAFGAPTAQEGAAPSGTRCALCDAHMNVGTYKGAAALTAYERWQDTIAQNLANVAVNGYRRNETAFSGVMADMTQIKNGDSVTQKSKGVMPLSTRGFNMTPGSTTYTGVDTNFAADGDGFFRIRKTDGTVAYTKNGNFRLSSDYNLVTQDGFLVEGDNGPITFRQEGGVISINTEGLLSQGQQQIGKLALFRFNDSVKLHRIEGGLLRPAADNPALPVERPVFIHKAIESSNVKPTEEMVNMISLNRAYDAAKKVLDVSDDTSGKAIQYLGGPA